MTRVIAKNIILLICLVFMSQVVYAIGEAFNISGRLADGNGLNRSGLYVIRFALFDAAQGGSELWSKTIRDINVREGLFQAILENDDDSGRNISRIAGRGECYLELQVAGGPGISGQEPPMTPRQLLASVPYALAAQISAEALSLRGAIAMWSGSEPDVPAGWCVCDGRTCTGADGNAVVTPDLRDRFILGTREDIPYNAATGGSDDPAIQLPPTWSSSLSAPVFHSEPGLTKDARKVRWMYFNFPPLYMGKYALYPKFYRLAYIMKV